MVSITRKLSTIFSDAWHQQSNSNLFSYFQKICSKIVPKMHFFDPNSLSAWQKLCVLIIAMMMALGCSSAFAQTKTILPLPKIALPTNGQVVAGSASINSSSTANSAVMNINQTSQRAVINWDSFNVGKNATVNFNQPNANAVTLNRVTSGSASVINGAINANGQVILVNSSGVVFGKGAEVNAAAVTASTLNIADQEFMDGKATYQDDGSGAGAKAGKIINKGTIRTNQTDPSNLEGGFIALLAPEVRNQGVLLAQKGGTVALGSGNQITLTIQGQSLVAIKVDQAAYNGLITNKHIIEAPGGLVVLATSAANQLMAGIIKNTGRISANSLVNNGGTIELVAKTVTQAGTVSTNSQTQTGGQINLTGQDITVAKNSSTTATGATAGGQVNIGLANTPVSGGTQINTATQAGIKANADLAASNGLLANTVTIEQNALIDTSATQTGNGGAIAIWSQVQTTVAGILKSMGGILSGNGGFIETSSKGAVSLAPTTQINTSANNTTGKAGTWLLDPVDLTIDASTANLISVILANSNVTIAVSNSTASCPMGSCTQSGSASSSLTIASGADILKAGTNYTTLTLSSSGIFNLNANISGQNLDVIIQSSIAYLNVGTSINASTVTVQAQTIYAQGSIQTTNYIANYLLGANSGNLGNAIQLLAQAIYVSGTLGLNGGLPNNTASVVTVGGVVMRPQDLPSYLLSLNADQNLNQVYSSSAANDPAQLQAASIANNVIYLTGSQSVNLMNTGQVLANGTTGGSIYLSAPTITTQGGSVVQANGNNGPGGLIAFAADQIAIAGTITANGSTDGGAITIIANNGDLNIQNSLIQTNGSAGRGGSIGASATGNVTITNTEIDATGYTQGGTIKIGNDASNGTLPFALSTSLDQYTTLNASQLDPSLNNQHGGMIETSGGTLSLLSSINAGRGGMWLLDPYDVIIGSDATTGGSLPNFTASENPSYVKSSDIESQINAGSSVTITASRDISVNASISKDASNGNSTLAFRAERNILISAGVTFSDVSPSSVLNLEFRAGGGIMFQDNSAGTNTINTHGYIYVGGLNSGAPNLTNASIGTETIRQGVYVGANVSLTTSADLILAGTAFNGVNGTSNSGYYGEFPNFAYGVILASTSALSAQNISIYASTQANSSGQAIQISFGSTAPATITALSSVNIYGDATLNTQNGVNAVGVFLAGAKISAPDISITGKSNNPSSSGICFCFQDGVTSRSALTSNQTTLTSNRITFDDGNGNLAATTNLVLHGISNQLAISGGLTAANLVVGAGTTALLNANLYSDSIALSTGASLVVSGDGGLGTCNSDGCSYSGAITVGVNAALTFSSSVNQKFTNLSAGDSTGVINLNGSVGSLVTIDGDQGFNGILNIAQNVVIKGGSNGLNTGLGNSNAININAGGYVDLQGGDNSFIGVLESIAPLITINAGGILYSPGYATFHLQSVILHGGAIDSLDPVGNAARYGTFNFDKEITVTANSVISAKGILLSEAGGTVINVATGVSLYVSGSFITTSDIGGGAGLILNSGVGFSGTTTLSGVNTYGGGTFVYNGVLKAGSVDAFSSGRITVDGGTLDVHGYSIGNVLYLAGDGADGQGALINSSRHHTATLNGNITLTADTTIGGRGNLILNGTITDPLATRNPLIKIVAQIAAALFQNYELLGSSLTKVGSGTVTLSNLSNTYGGQTIIEDGVLAIAADGSLGSLPLLTMRALLVLNGGTLEALNTMSLNAKRGITLDEYGALAVASGGILTINPVISGDGALRFNPWIRGGYSPGTIVLAGRNTYTGETVLLGGTLQTNVGYSNRSGGYSALGNVTDLYISGGILNLQNTTQKVGEVTIGSRGGQINTGTLTATSYTFNNNECHPVTITTNLAGSGASLTQAGSGTTTLSGNNTYSGTTTVNGGTLVLNNVHALGNSSNVTLDDGGTLVLNQSNTVGTLTIGSYGGSIIGDGTLTATSYTFNNNECHPVTITANLVGSGASLTQAGSGTTTLSGVNTYGGGTFVYNGVLKAGSVDAFSSGRITVDGGTLDVHGYSIGNVLYLAGDGADGQGALINSSRHHTATLNGNITLTADTTIGGRGNLILNGTITDPLATRNPLIKIVAQIAAALFQNYELLGSSLTKVGSGTVTLSNLSNTYGGQTIIEDGVLAIAADGSLGSLPLLTMRALLVLNGGTLEALNTMSLNAKRGITLDEYGALAVASGGILTINPVISGDGALRFNPWIRGGYSPGTIVLAGRNTYTGETVLLGGTLQTNVGYSNRSGGYSALGNVTDLYISGGILNLQNTTQKVGEVTIGSRGGQINTGTLTATSYTFNNNECHPVTITTNLAGSGASLTQAGSGTTTLSGNNTYSGNTTVSAGTLALTSTGTLGNTTSLLTISSGTLDLQGNSLTVGSLAMSGNTPAITNSSSTSSLTVNGTSTLAGNITTGGLQTYTGAVTLGADTTLSAGSGNISLSNTVDGNYALTVNSSGTTTFSSAIGATTALASITTDSGGTLVLNGTSIKTNGAQNFNDPITLGTDATLTTTNNPINLAAITGASHSLSTSSGSGSQSFASIANVNQLSINSTGSVSQSGSFGVSNLLLAGAGAYTLNNANNTITTVAANAITSLNLVDHSDLTIGTIGLVNGLSASGAITLNVTGTILVNQSIVITGTANTLLNSSAIFTIASGASISTHNGTIVVAGSQILINSTSSSALSAGGTGNYWQIWSSNANPFNATTSFADKDGSIVYGYKQYNASFGSTSVLGSGNGLLFTYAPTVTVVLSGTISKFYDGLSTASLSSNYSATPTGVAGDVITLNNPATGTFQLSGSNDINAHTGLTVAVSGISLNSVISSTGATVYGYGLGVITNNLNGVISPKAVTITNAVSSTTYDGVTTYSTLVANAGFTTTAMVDSDAVASVTQTSTISGSTVSGVAQAGSFVAIPSAAVLSTGTAGNYSFSYVAATNTVAKANLTISETASTTGNTYNGSAYTGSYITTFLGSDASHAVVSGMATGTNAGTYTSTLSVANAPGSSVMSNYSTPSYSDATLVISPRPITISADTNQTKIYGNSDPMTFTYSVQANTTNAGLVGTDTFAGSLTRAAGENVGTYVIGRGSLANSNYNITFAPASFAITARPITLSASAATKVYGEVDPSLAVTITSGSLASATVTDSLVSVTGTLTRSPGENVGNYNILLGTGSSASNYAITYNSNNQAMSITTRSIYISADANQSKIYGNSDPTLTYTTQALTSGSGLLGTDGATVSGALSRAAGENVGSYAIGQGTVGVNSSNYNIVYSAANLAITARPITIAADANQIKIYGNVDPSLTYTVQPNTTNAGLVGADNFAGSITRATGENVGSYVIGQGSLANSNYKITFVSNNFAINKADLTITPTIGQSKNYGQSDPTLTYAASGLISNSLVNDTSPSSVISGSLSRVAGENIGSYSFDVGGMSASNYNIRLVSSPTTFAILPTPIGITISGTYSGTNTITPTSFTVTGLAFGQTISSISSAVVNDPNVASNGSNYVSSVIGVSGSAIMSNYYITAHYNGILNTTTTNIATITPANLVIAAANDAKFVTQTDIFASSNNCGPGPCAGGYLGLTFNGFVNGETQANLIGSPTIVRTNASINSAGLYTGVLQPSGYTSSNYNINYVNGDYIIAPANALLVRVNPASTIYGSSPNYTATVAYLAKDGSTIVNLTPSISGSNISVSDGVGGSATFNLSLLGANLSTSGNINVGGYNLSAINTVITGSNFNNLMVVGSATIKPFTLNPSQLGITNLTKVYDGNINIGGLVINVDPTLSQVLGSGSSKDQVTILGSGIFTDNANVGTNKNISVALSLSGVDGNNYVLSSNSYSAAIGTITQLSSVNYVGPSGGNWSTQTNWAGGAIPNFNNVATAIVPVGYSVVYDASVMGHIGSIIQNNGTVTFAESTPYNLSNTLSGNGIFTQTGSAPLTISGNNGQSSPGAFTGQFTIASGSTLLFGSTNAMGSGSIVSSHGNFGLSSGTTLANLNISGPVNLITNISTIGSQVYGGLVTIAYGNQSADGAMHISSQNGDITFAGGVNSDSGNRSLTIDAASGLVSFMDSVGILSSDRLHKSPDIYDLTVNAKNIQLFADVSTLSSQTYNGAVVIGDNGSNGLVRIFTSQDPSIVFGGTVDDSSAVTHTLDARAISYDVSQAPVVAFRGPVGSITPLGALNVTTEMNLDTPPPPHTDTGGVIITSNITTVGSQNFNTSAVILQPSGGSSISLSSTKGTVQFSGLSDDSLASLRGQIAINNFYTPSANSNSGLSNTYLPPLFPSEEQFSLEGGLQFAQVLVEEHIELDPCESETKTGCARN